MDLIGLIGGTLGIFIGFSFYGTIADLLDLAQSLVLKLKVMKNTNGKLCALFGHHFEPFIYTQALIQV